MRNRRFANQRCLKGTAEHRSHLRRRLVVESLEVRTLLSASPWAGLLGQGMPSVLDSSLMEIDPREPADFLDPPAAAGAGGEAAPVASPAPLADTFFLHSNPAADHTIYLDFDGHVTEGTTWNSYYGVTTINSPAYDPSGDGPSFNDAELARIQRIWQRVAEDYAPFNVDVTTEDPGAEDLRKSGVGDQRWGTRAVVTDDTFANCGCGGHAFIGSFNDSQDEPVFVYNKSEIGVSAAVSHEVGHALYLSHDGQGTSEYYNGHGSGETGWGPIMGSGYYKNMTTWDTGEYYNTTNSGPSANYNRGPDDLQVITTYNGFGFLADDHGGTIGSATTLDVLGPNATDPTLVDVQAFGIVGDPNDLDFFSFSTAAGTINLTIDSYYSRLYTSLGDGSYSTSYEATPVGDQGTNLDVLATLYDAEGGFVTSSNPAAGLSASFTNLSLPAGTYYVSVDSTGYGDWTANPPTGYSEYVSLGQFLISGTIVSVVSDPPVANDDTATTDEDTAVIIDVLANDSDPDGDPLSVVSVTQGASGSVAINADDTVTYTPNADFNGTDSFTYTASDGLGGTDTAAVVVTVDPVTDISIAPLDADKSEGNSDTTVFTFTVSLDEAAAVTVTADWSVVGSGASQADAADFGGSLPSGTVTFLAGEMEQDVMVNVAGDTDVEDDEGFTVALSNPSGGVTIGTGSAFGLIQNDDIPPVYSYVDVAASDVNTYGTVSGSLLDTFQRDDVNQSITEELYQRNRRSRLEHTWTFDVTGGDIGVSFHLFAGHDSSTESFEFQYDVQDGLGWQSLITLSSTAPKSYTAALPNSISGQVLVRVVDTDQGPNETSTDTVSIDEMYFVSERTSVLPPNVSIIALDAEASETGPDGGQFRVELTDGLPQTSNLTVLYAIGGSADGADYTETLSGSVVIPAGQLSAPILVTPVDDEFEEGTETVVLTLLDDAAYRLAAAEATVTIADNDVTEFFAQSEIAVFGTVAGDYTATHSVDGIYETLAEELYTGGNKKSRLEHHWSFDLSGTTNVDFVLAAEHVTPGDPDDFQFQLSTDGGATWMNLLTLSTSSPAEQTTAVSLPPGVAAVIVRVVDTDDSKDRSSAQLQIDQMMFRLPGTGSAAATDAETSPPALGAAELDYYSFQIDSARRQGHVNDRASLADALMANDNDPFWPLL